jgi:chromosome segregation ATPase
VFLLNRWKRPWSNCGTSGASRKNRKSRDEIAQQYADVVARLNNARNTEKSLTDVQHQRTGKVEEVLEVQKEVARAREEIGRLEAQRQALDSQMTVASIDVYVREEQNKAAEPPQASPGSRLWSAIGDGCQQAVEQMVGTLSFIFRCLPSIVLWTAVLFLPLRFAWRRWRPALQELG